MNDHNIIAASFTGSPSKSAQTKVAEAKIKVDSIVAIMQKVEERRMGEADKNIIPQNPQF